MTKQVIVTTRLIKDDNKLHGPTCICSRMRGNYICKSLANSGENNKSNNFQHSIRVLYEYRYVHIYSYKIDLSLVKRIKLQWTRTQMSRQHTRTKQTTLHEQNTCKYNSSTAAGSASTRTQVSAKRTSNTKGNAPGAFDSGGASAIDPAHTAQTPHKNQCTSERPLENEKNEGWEMTE